MRKHVTRLAFMAFLVLLLVALPPLAAACGDDDEEEKTPAAEEKEITIGGIFSLTGVAASATARGFELFSGMVKYINEVEGGIDGIKIKLVWADDKYDPATAVIAAKRLRDRHHPILWIVQNDSLAFPAKDMFERDKTPLLTSTAYVPEIYSPPGMFFNMSGCEANIFTGVVKWVLQDYEASGGVGRPKLGTLHWDAPFGNAHKLGNAYKWAQEHGVDIVERTYPMMALDIRPHLLALADEEVDYIYVVGVLTDVTLLVRDARATGLWDKIKFVHNVGLLPYDLLEVVGDQAEGLYAVAYTPTWADGLPAHREWAKVAEWVGFKPRRYDQAGYYSMKLVLTALLRQAIADVGFEDLDGEALYNAFQKLRHVDTNGIFYDASWGPDRRIGLSGIKIKQYTKTETVSVTDWIETTNIFEGKEW